MLVKQFKYLVLLLPLICTSCDFIKIKDNDTVVTPDHSVSVDAKTIADAMIDVDKDDVKLMYMQFAGLAHYMTHTDRIKDTASLFKIIESFQSDYKYSREKYKNYTDVVEAFLMKRGYEDVKNIVPVISDSKTEIARSQVIEDMQTLADAAKIVMEKK